MPVSYTHLYNVAKQFAKQDKAATQLGEVSKDMLIADMSDAVFDLKAGDYTNPIKSELGWHIMKVTNICLLYTSESSFPAATRLYAQSAWT